MVIRIHKYLIIGLSLFCLVHSGIVGCEKKDGNETATRTDKGKGKIQGTIRVSGAWGLYPMMVRWAEEFGKIHPKVRIDISAGGAGKGVVDAISGLVDIGMVSREIKPEEQNTCIYVRRNQLI